MTPLIARSHEHIRAVPTGAAFTAAQPHGGLGLSTTKALRTRGGDVAPPSSQRRVALKGAPARPIEARGQL
jgi:hypothetical protein